MNKVLAIKLDNGDVQNIRNFKTTHITIEKTDNHCFYAVENGKIVAKLLLEEDEGGIFKQFIKIISPDTATYKITLKRLIDNPPFANDILIDYDDKNVGFYQPKENTERIFK